MRFAVLGGALVAAVGVVGHLAGATPSAGLAHHDPRPDGLRRARASLDQVGAQATALLVPSGIAAPGKPCSD